MVGQTRACIEFGLSSLGWIAVCVWSNKYRVTTMELQVDSIEFWMGTESETAWDWLTELAWSSAHFNCYHLAPFKQEGWWLWLLLLPSLIKTSDSSGVCERGIRKISVSSRAGERHTCNVYCGSFLRCWQQSLSRVRNLVATVRCVVREAINTSSYDLGPIWNP